MSGLTVRENEELLLGLARQLLGQPAPGPDTSYWDMASRVNYYRNLVRELAAALELRREAPGG